MTNVYILTQEGRAYSTEGLLHVKNILTASYDINPESDIMYNQGQIYNDPSSLLSKLSQDKDQKNMAVIIISTSDGIFSLLVDDEILDFIKLEIPFGQTTWEAFKAIIDSHAD